MNISKISIVGYLVGLAMIIISIRQYYFLYPDIDKLFAYVLLGLVAIGVVFNHSSGRQRDKKINHIDDVMEEIIKTGEQDA